jgi:hypothetical protein
MVMKLIDPPSSTANVAEKLLPPPPDAEISPETYFWPPSTITKDVMLLSWSSDFRMNRNKQSKQQKARGSRIKCTHQQYLQYFVLAYVRNEPGARCRHQAISSLRYSGLCRISLCTSNTLCYNNARKSSTHQSRTECINDLFNYPSSGSECLPTNCHSICTDRVERTIQVVGASGYDLNPVSCMQ